MTFFPYKKKYWLNESNIFLLFPNLSNPSTTLHIYSFPKINFSSSRAIFLNAFSECIGLRLKQNNSSSKCICISFVPESVHCHTCFGIVFLNVGIFEKKPNNKTPTKNRNKTPNYTWMFLVDPQKDQCFLSTAWLTHCIFLCKIIWSMSWAAGVPRGESEGQHVSRTLHPHSVLGLDLWLKFLAGVFTALES